MVASEKNIFEEDGFLRTPLILGSYLTLAVV